MNKSTGELFAISGLALTLNITPQTEMTTSTQKKKPEMAKPTGELFAISGLALTLNVTPPKIT